MPSKKINKEMMSTLKILILIVLLVTLKIMNPLISGGSYANGIYNVMKKDVKYYLNLHNKNIKELKKEIGIEIDNLLKALKNKKGGGKISETILKLRNLLDNRTIIKVYLTQKELSMHEKDKLRFIAKLYSIKDSEVEKIICGDLLLNRNPYVRLESVIILGVLKRKTSVPCLMNVLFDKDKLVRKYVVKSLAEIVDVDISE